METASVNPPIETLSFEKVWFLIQETNKQMKETDKKLQEGEHKFQDFVAESRRIERRMAKEMKALNALFTGHWGALIESLVDGKIVQILQERGIDVKLTYQNIKDEDGRIEFDIVAANGSDIVVVEVKTKFKLEDLEYFSEKLPKFKELSDAYIGKRIYGAIAFLKTEQGIINKAEKLGLFIIRASGDSAKIINKAVFEPKAW